MERQAGLGRSLEDVLDAVPPIEPTDPPRTHALFGIAAEDAPVIVPVANGTSHSGSKKTKKSKTSKGDDKKKKKKKKSKSGKKK